MQDCVCGICVYLYHRSGEPQYSNYGTLLNTVYDLTVGNLNGCTAICTILLPVSLDCQEFAASA